jgi:hypothetical protein
MRRVENETSMKLVAGGMKIWPLDMKYKLMVRNACAWYEIKAHETKPVSQGMKLLYKGMKKIKKISGSEKVISQSMKLLYKGMKKVKFFLGSEKVVHKV